MSFKSQLEHLHAQPITNLAFVAHKKLLPNEQANNEAASWPGVLMGAPADYGLMS